MDVNRGNLEEIAGEVQEEEEGEEHVASSNVHTTVLYSVEDTPSPQMCVVFALQVNDVKKSS